jgi:hypothetical protein
MAAAIAPAVASAQFGMPSAARPWPERANLEPAVPHPGSPPGDNSKAPWDPYAYLYAARHEREQADTSLLQAQPAQEQPGQVQPGQVQPGQEQPGQEQPAAADPAAGWAVAGQPPPGAQSSTARIVVSAAFAALAIAAAVAILVLVRFQTAARPAFSARSAPAAQPIPAAPSGSPAPSAPAAGPTAPAGALPSRTPAPGTSTVTVTPGAADQPQAEAVAVFVTNYFAAINSHDYLAFRNLLSTGLQPAETPQRFRAGYRTTIDSAVTIESIAAGGAGRMAVTVTFISHQAPADSPDGSACDSWRITMFLVHAGGYLISQPPPSYQVSYQNCLQTGT